MTPKQEQYVAELARCGSAVHARRAVGVTRRTVSNWGQDEAFAEAAAEAQELANAEILSKAREQAMAGDTSLLGVWMRALIPALRPANSTQVAVGVKVGGDSIEDARHRQLKAMSDRELLAELDRFHRDLQMRVECGRPESGARGEPLRGAGEAVDVVATPVAQPEPGALSGPENEPDAEDLL